MKITRGDLTPEQFRGLASIMRDFTGGYARTTVHQNLVLRWVRDEALYDVWLRAQASSGSATPGADEITDVVSLPGHRLAASSASRARWASTAPCRSALESIDISDPLTRKIHIKMCGCPNGCSQHHIANIGFYGASIKVGEHTIPAYVAHIGGTYERRRGRLRHAPEGAPARQARARRRRALDPLYEADRAATARSSTPSPSASAPSAFEDEVKDLAHAARVQPREHERLHRLDARTSPFEVVRGEGECAV